MSDVTGNKEIIEKDSVPHFLPTYRIKINLFPLPILFVIIFAGILAYLTYYVAGVQVEGGYVSEEEYGAFGGILNGIIFTVMSVGAAFLIVFIIKKRGIDVLKYVFGFTFGFLGFFLTWFFASIIIYLIFIQFPETPYVISAYYIFAYIVSPILVCIFTFFLLYYYFTSKSIITKNSIILFISLLISAAMGVIMPLWSTLAILIFISLWDIYAVLSKRGPIKEMIDIASMENQENEEIDAKIKSGEAEYDTSKIEIGIGDLVFYSILTSSALIQTNNIFIMISTSIAILIGTGITILGLKRNKILPGLPISIFLGIGTMLLSCYLFSILPV